MSDHVEELAKIIRKVFYLDMGTASDIARAIISAGWVSPHEAMLLRSEARNAADRLNAILMDRGELP